MPTQRKEDENRLTVSYLRDMTLDILLPLVICAVGAHH
jgi:hypothetical protein